jgi:hypothetical protein
MRHDADAIRGHLDTGTGTSSVHVEGAFPFGDSGSSTSSESPTEQALSLIYTPTDPRDLEGPGLSSSINGWAEPFFGKQDGRPNLMVTHLSVLGGFGGGERELSKGELLRMR